MILDTDIIIWSLRGRGKASDYIDALDKIYISDVTYMELVQGTVDKKEFRDLKKTLEKIQVERIPVSDAISKKAVELVEMFSHSHSMQLADALIAATAITCQLPLSSGNRKHFEQIAELDFHAIRV